VTTRLSYAVTEIAFFIADKEKQYHPDTIPYQTVLQERAIAKPIQLPRKQVTGKDQISNFSTALHNLLSTDLMKRFV
jgi:hypothetical protein